MLRHATAQDAVHLAALMDMAGQGLATQLWQALSGADCSPSEFGRLRIKNSAEQSSHYTRWTIFSEDNEVRGAFAAHACHGSDAKAEATLMQPVVAPLMELESLATGCWLLSSLAVYPEFRNRGVGACLLEAAMQQAKAHDMPLALIVRRENGEARNLYDKFGFVETARRARILPDGRDSRDEWLLLKNEISPR